MKRLATPTCAVVIAASLLAACGSSSKTAATTSAATTATTAAAASTATTAKATASTPAATAATTAAATATTAAGEATTAAAAASGTDTTPAIVKATTAFLATLTDAEKKTVSFDFTDTAQRQKWSNLPDGLYKRSGLMWGNMTDASKNAWLAVMQTTLSKEGYTRVRGEWAADDLLGGGSYGQAHYYIAVVGTPSDTAAWQWQWGGHHVTVNATIVGPKISLTPSFIGAQPTTITVDGAKVRPIGDIEDEAFALVNSLDATQKPKAVLGMNIIDLVLGPGADGKTIAAEGLPGSAMTDTQKTAFLQLMAEYGGLLNDEDAASRMADLKANLDKTYLAWYGPTTAGSGIYFRITGPTVVIEYSGQSMGGNTANHIHGIYRDPTNDYGAALGAGLK